MVDFLDGFGVVGQAVQRASRGQRLGACTASGAQFLCPPQRGRPTCRRLCLGRVSRVVRVGAHAAQKPLSHVQVGGVRSPRVTCGQHTHCQSPVVQHISLTGPADKAHIVSHPWYNSYHSQDLWTTHTLSVTRGTTHITHRTCGQCSLSPMAKHNRS